MFGIELEVETRRQQFIDEAERSRLAYVAKLPCVGIYTQISSAVQKAVVLWNARFQKDVAQVVEACCAVVAVPEAECVECAAIA